MSTACAFFPSVFDPCLICGRNACGLLRLAANLKWHALQHPALGRPEGHVDRDGSGLGGVQVHVDRGPGAGGDVEGPVLLRTGAAQLASAPFAVDAGQADRFAPGVGDRNLDRVIDAGGERADVQRLDGEHRRGDASVHHIQPPAAAQPTPIAISSQDRTLATRGDMSGSGNGIERIVAACRVCCHPSFSDG